MRDRLIELIDDFIHSVDVSHWYSEELDEKLADELLANGIIVPPCKVGDRLYEIVEMNHTAHKHHNVFISSFPITVEPYQIVYRNIMGGYSCIPFDDFGKTVFLTREEAEKALAKRAKET